MKGKKLLVAFLLGAGLCFVPVLGYGEVIIPGHGTQLGDLFFGGVKDEILWPYVEGTCEDVRLLRLENALLNARIQYIMRNPTNFLTVDCYYDSNGRFSYPNIFFPEGVETKGKIVIFITDNRGEFYLSGVALLDVLSANLKVIYSFLSPVATNMDTDIVAVFDSKGGIPLGYFYQGEYHLWGEW